VVVVQNNDNAAQEITEHGPGERHPSSHANRTICQFVVRAFPRAAEEVSRPTPRTGAIRSRVGSVENSREQQKLHQCADKCIWKGHVTMPKGVRCGTSRCRLTERLTEAVLRVNPICDSVREDVLFNDLLTQLRLAS
jgi:hypothetical protein